MPTFSSTTELTSALSLMVIVALSPLPPHMSLSLSLTLTLALSRVRHTEALQSPTAIPKPMKSIVHKQNLEFLHHKSHYSFPYFQFMKNFLILNGNHIKAVLERNPHMTVGVGTLVHMCECFFFSPYL